MAGEIQLNSTTMATESSGTITLSNVDSATNRTNLGLGSMATQAADSVAITGGTIGSGVVFPAGHIIQIKTAVLAPTFIVTTNTSFQPVSGLDLTLTRTANTYVVYMIMGGGLYTSVADESLHTTVKRSDGSSYSGTNELDLGASNNYGMSRSYGINSPILHPHSGGVVDTSNISGSYSYRTFFRSVGGESVQFSFSDRANTLAIIFEFNPS